MGNMFSFNNAYGKLIMEDQQDAKLQKGQTEFTFTSNLAAEFTHTVNEFTNICAKMVENRSVTKDMYQKFDDLYSKIKNLIDASKNS